MIWMDNSRILAIFAVVFLHVAAGAFMGNALGSGNWWAGNIYDSAVHWCVPIFVMISGALLLDTTKTESPEVFYRKRATRILIPLVFWSLAYLAWNQGKGSLDGHRLSGGALARLLLSGKPHYHMWFLYMILVLYLITPFLRKLVKACTPPELALITALCFAIAILNAGFNLLYPPGPSLFTNWFLAYLPYFLIGHLIKTSEGNYPRRRLLGILATSVAATALGCYFLTLHRNAEAGLYFYGDLGITVVPMSVSLMFLLKRWTKPIINPAVTRQLSALTFGVYLIHPMVLETLNGLVKTANYPAKIYIPVVTVGVYGVSLGLAWAVAKVPLLNRTI